MNILWILICSFFIIFGIKHYVDYSAKQEQILRQKKKQIKLQERKREMIFYPKKCYIQIEPIEEGGKEKEYVEKMKNLGLDFATLAKPIKPYKLWKVVKSFGGGNDGFSKRLATDDIILVENNMVQHFQDIYWIHENHIIGFYGLEN